MAKDILSAVLNPSPAGLHPNDELTDTVCGKVGSGVLCLWAAMNKYRPHSLEYQRKLKKTMLKSPYLFRGGDPRKHIEAIDFVVRECMALGVRLPWDEIGAETINVMAPKGTYGNFLHQFRAGCPDPDDCAPYLQRLYAAIKIAAGNQGEEQGTPSHYNRASKVYANQTHALAWNEDDQTYDVDEVYNKDVKNDEHEYEWDDHEYVYAYDINHITPSKGGGRKGKGAPSKGGKGVMSKGKSYGKSSKGGKGGKTSMAGKGSKGVPLIVQ